MEEDNLQEINITVKLVNSFNVDEGFLLDILNGLGDHLVPVDEIKLNGATVFNKTEGFHLENL